MAPSSDANVIFAFIIAVCYLLLPLKLGVAVEKSFFMMPPQL
jgi:hypothetical protein